MKTILTTVRLPEKVMKILDEKAKKENLDRATILRRFLEDSIKTWKIEEASKLYTEGKVSLGEAARMAELSSGDMMDELTKRGVKSDLTVEEYKETLNTSFKLFGKKKS